VAKTTFYPKTKRLEKLTRQDEENLAFDLINAFALVKTPADSALLLHDLLTGKEIKNLAKRLRIAKLILSEQKQEDIIDELHCSFGTVAKVKAWLDEGGSGLKRIIKKLPKRTSESGYKQAYPSPNLPVILSAAFQYIKYAKETKTVNRFLDSLEQKDIIDKHIREALDEEYKDKYHQKVRKSFVNSTSLHRIVENEE